MKLTKEQKLTLAKNKPKSKNHYVDNVQFFKDIMEYKKACRVAKKNGAIKPKIPDKIGKCLLLIAQNQLNKSWFMGYTQSYKEEMLGDAMENVIQYFDNFDPKKSHNPFSYMSQICYFAFKRRIDREKKQLYTKYKMVQQSGVMDVIEHEQPGDDDHQVDVQMYDNLNEFIARYEAALAADKARSRKPVTPK
jgi:hypothetical protein